MIRTLSAFVVFALAACGGQEHSAGAAPHRTCDQAALDKYLNANPVCG